MEQNDLNLLHTVPLHHLQTLIKSRHLPLTPKGPLVNTSTELSSITISEIAQHLFNPSAIDEALSNLGEQETLILHELVACGGRANSRDLALFLSNSDLFNISKGTEPLLTNDLAAAAPEATQKHPQGVPQYPIPHPHGVFELALRHLLLLGLLFWGKQTNFGGRDYTSGVYDGILIVPQAVMNEVKSKHQREHRQGENCQQNSESHINEGIHALQGTLYLYWSLVAATREGLPLVNNGLLSRQALRQVMEQLGPDSYRVREENPVWGTGNASDMTALRSSVATPAPEIRAEYEVPHLLFIRLLLMKLGLLREQQGMLRAAPARAFFSLPLLERACRCYRAWLEDTFWNELMHLAEVVMRPGPAPLDPAHEEVVQARQTVVARVLSEWRGAVGAGVVGSGVGIPAPQAGLHASALPPSWCDFSTFIAHTKLYAPYLLFPRRYGSRADRYSLGSNPYGWDFRLRRGWLTHREGWHLVEGGFIRAVISGPLYWLGLVELNNEDNPTSFRPAEGISLVTSDVPISIEEPPAGRLIVQPNFELVALAPISEALLINLDRFAERTSLERIAQYRLTKAGVTRAIQLGLHADTIQQTLEQASGGEIPQNVRYSLLEWERQARRIELWRAATLLEVDDPTVLDKLYADVETRPLLGRRLAPTMVEIPRHQLSALQEALWQRDYLPALVSASVHDTPRTDVSLLPSLPMCEPQWRLCDDGLLQPLYAVSNLYLLAELERFSELDEATGWRHITPAALQRARDAGLSLENVMRFLKDYCEGGVPNSFFIRLKLWGGGYDGQPTIQVEHAPLLALPAQVLQDLQADEELRELLGTEVAPQLRLVHVVPDKLERVIELLRERGFEVT